MQIQCMRQEYQLSELKHGMDVCETIVWVCVWRLFLLFVFCAVVAWIEMENLGFPFSHHNKLGKNVGKLIHVEFSCQEMIA